MHMYMRHRVNLTNNNVKVDLCINLDKNMVIKNRYADIIAIPRK